MNSIEVANRIKSCAKSRGITQTYICAAIGKRRTFINEVVAGKDRIDEEELEKIASVLGVSSGYLSGVADDPSRKIATFKELVQSACKSSGISQKHLCDLLNKDRAFLSNVFRGFCVITDDQIRIIADALSTTSDYLLGVSDDPTPKAVTFKERLKQTCKEKGISQKYLTDKIGRKNTYLNDIWNGKCALKPEDLNSFADVLGVSPDYLAGKTDDPTPADSLSASDKELVSLVLSLSPEQKELVKKIAEEMK